MLNRFWHRLRGHEIHTERRYWHEPPGKAPLGPYDLHSCSCGKEWVSTVVYITGSAMWQF